MLVQGPLLLLAAALLFAQGLLLLLAAALLPVPQMEDEEVPQISVERMGEENTRIHQGRLRLAPPTLLR